MQSAAMATPINVASRLETILFITHHPEAE
jgi:hypothetical protein